MSDLLPRPASFALALLLAGCAQDRVVIGADGLERASWTHDWRADPPTCDDGAGAFRSATPPPRLRPGAEERAFGLRQVGWSLAASGAGPVTAPRYELDWSPGRLELGAPFDPGQPFPPPRSPSPLALPGEPLPPPAPR